MIFLRSLRLAALLSGVVTCLSAQGATPPAAAPAPQSPPDSQVTATSAKGSPKQAKAKQGAAAGKSAARKKNAAKRAKAPVVAVDSEAKLDSMYDLRWPVKGPEPLPGSILPNKRIIAYYGNPFSKRMGVLGEYEPDQMLSMLDAEVKAWTAADPATPVQPALHLIAVVAQAGAGTDGKYRARMPDELIERVAAWATRRNALVFLDVQVGKSTLPEELPRLEKFLARPNFHLGIDPEFSMKNGGIPGKKIGTYDAEDVNYASRFLQDIVTRHKVTPKVLVVHRFTRKGVTNFKQIKLDPRVQVVMHMDGFGPPRLKRATFRSWIKAEPVQFVGWKQFYKARNDNPRTTIAEILKLNPRPLYIQYQ
ncbi:MAG: hypothetical protein P3B98_09840 [Gemmatimonadota bacterium]|nr:hypothetical protein [Gemmatimonadota bacterium]